MMTTEAEKRPQCKETVAKGIKNDGNYKGAQVQREG